MEVEPVPDEPAAVVETGSGRALVVADYHAGIEAILRSDGVELDDRGDERRTRLRQLVAETDPDRLVVLGDLVHSIGEPWRAEREELDALFGALSVPVTLVKGNHDGDLEGVLAECGYDVTVTDTGGVRLGDVGFAHGHTWPGREVLAAEIVCVGHEHPVVRLEDSVGGRRVERAWLRGGIDPEPFEHHYGEVAVGNELVVFPAFNDLSGGTWINVERREFLSPFLPEAFVDTEAYLLDGTRLGPYRRV